MSSPFTFIKPNISIAIDLPSEKGSAEVLSAARSRSWANSTAKRVFDVTLAALLLVLMMPILAIIACVVKLSSHGPILFRQRRRGKGQTSFVIYKFRTMQWRDEEGSLVTFKADARITPAGRILRHFKLDELPQLYNVLRGDMSFVGPRPKVIGHEQAELPCKPGLTGAATLIFAREESLLNYIPEGYSEAFVVDILHPIKASVDGKYAKQCTFMSDVRILFDTALHVGKRAAPPGLEELAITYRASIENSQYGPSNNTALIQDAVATYNAWAAMHR